MLGKIKMLIVATLVATSATSAFAASTHHRNHGRTYTIERYDDRLIEERNAAPEVGYYGNLGHADRNSMVETLGN